MTLSLIRLAGSQAEMGAQHGRMVADDAARLYAFYDTLPERTLMGDKQGLPRLAVRALATLWQRRLVSARRPDLLARTHAFVEATLAMRPEVKRSAALRAFAVMDSLQNCVATVARVKLGPFALGFDRRASLAAVPACSTVMAWGDATRDGELLFARNFDFPGVGVWDVAPAFVTCAPSEGQRYGFFTARGADTAVVTVVNEAGITIAPHTRWHRDVVFGGAMIVDLVHDIARRAETLDDAVAIARERPVSSSWGLAIGSARERRGIALEIAGRHVEVIVPTAGATSLVCNNHYHGALRDGELAGSRAWAVHTERREQRLRALVEKRERAFDDVALARLLGDRRDPNMPEMVRYFGGIVAQPVNVHAAVVTPARRRALVGIDRAPSCEGRWAELEWDWSGPVGEVRLDDAAIARDGFVARVRDDVAAPHDPATLAVREAAQAYEGAHDVETARAAIERAIEYAPADPSLRLAGLWLALEAGAPARAVEHARAGLAQERDRYRRDQLLAWGVRAARGVDPALDQQWQAELAGGDPDLVALARRRGRPHIALMLADAY
jgi:hypothetical protein